MMKKNVNPSIGTDNIFKNIFEYIIDGIILVDTETKRFSMSNPALCRMLGYTKEELLNISVYDIHPKETLPRIEQLFNQLIKKEIELAKDIPVLRRDGNLFYADIAASPIHYNGRPHLLATFRDVTERRDAEEQKNAAVEALRESEARLSAFIEQASIAIVIAKYKKLIFVNPRFVRMFGYDDASELIGKSIYDIITISERSRIRTEETASQGKKIFINQVEAAVYRKDGTEFWIHADISDVYDYGSLGFITDITDRVNAERELRHNEELLRKTLNTTADGIMLVDNNGKISHFNRRFIDMWKIPQHIVDTLDDKTMISFVIDQLSDPAGFLKKVEELYSSKQECFDELRFKDGRVFERYTSPIMIQGVKFGRVWDFRDITEHKQAEENLKKSEERLIKAQIIGQIGYMEKVITSQDVWMSSESMRIFGFPPKEGFVPFEKVKACFIDYESSQKDSYYELLKNGKRIECESVISPADGSSPKYVHQLVDMERDTDGKPCKFLSTFQDITERKLAEKELISSEETFRKAFSSNPMVISLSTFSDGRYIDINDNFTKMLEWEREEVIGRTSLDLNIFCDNKQHYEMAAYIRENGHFRNFEIKINTKSGKTRIGELSAELVEIKGEQCLLVQINDITERRQAEEDHKRLEQQLSHSQRMDAIGQLAGGVAHDINNILMGIQGNISLIMTEFNADDPRYKRFVQIEEYVKRGSKLTKQLLGFARGGKYEVKTLSINDLIRKSAQLFLESRKEIKTEFQLQDNIYPVDADAGQIEQTLLNIFINAGHAMPYGGQLRIQTANTTIREADAAAFDIKAGDYVKISISDTGIGMDKEIINKIFEPFFTTKAQQGGTGLGLASAYGIIRNHGGAIKVYSEPGQGSTFNIYIPSSLKPFEEEDQAPQKGIISGSGGILLVDDESVILDTASDMLEMLGYTVHKAVSGQEASAIYREKQDRIDLVILDMIMPGTSGSHVLKALMDINPDVKVILTSGYGLQGEVQKVMEMGCRGFIQKPYNFTELSNIVHHVLYDL